MTLKKAANKHELRTQETRTLLLKAAETIFARDGYEGAELGEIAALAGRTKGSIYAQFKSKEDIFLALVEDRTMRHRARMEKMLAASTTIEGNIAALRSFYMQLAEDRAWALLLLEFKLFTIRHPDSKKQYQELYGTVLSEENEARYTEILGSVGKDAISRVLAVQSLLPVICALILEAQLGTGLSKKSAFSKVITHIFDALIEAPGK